MVSVLAISSVRQSSLEARITGSVIEEKRLLNSTESALRNTEASIGKSLLPPDRCAAAVVLPCVWTKSLDNYAQDFGDALAYSGNGIDQSSRTTVKRYMLAAPAGSLGGESINPEYGSMMLGNGTFFYEVNSQATSNGRNASLRSVIARVYNN
ncbi:hypothetical protein D9M71_524430 [compost metagenome]